MPDKSSPEQPIQRKKIAIRPIAEVRKRHVTFQKRKKGLLKKARELSILCGCDMAVVIFDQQGQCFQFASHDIDKTLSRFESSIAQGSGIFRESKTNADVSAAPNSRLLAGNLIMTTHTHWLFSRLVVVPNFGKAERRRTCARSNR